MWASLCEHESCSCKGLLAIIEWMCKISVDLLGESCLLYRVVLVSYIVKNENIVKQLSAKQLKCWTIFRHINLLSARMMDGHGRCICTVVGSFIWHVVNEIFILGKQSASSRGSAVVSKLKSCNYTIVYCLFIQPIYDIFIFDDPLLMFIQHVNHTEL